ncbi:hypothetical protein KKD19_03195 [Patescibacteria group bacterium]|nr:hypothetical protein [Patescibacteria group bacterium]MBU4512222.1 hypothetical protein [Patescibacteria group bacterium]MCG2692640.1 hypothetical protein [Candidatus Parcubacteria bacterium]
MPNWNDVLVNSSQDAWAKLMSFLPNLIAAIIIFIIGWIVAVVLGTIAKAVVKKLWIDKAIEKLGLVSAIEKTGLKLGKFSLAGAIGWLVKWFIIVVSFSAAVDIMNLTQVNDFLNKVLLYIPNVIVAVIILIIGILLAYVVTAAIERGVKTVDIASGPLLIKLTRWAILIFTIMAALVQLKVAPELIQILFTGLVVMVTLAGGLAFGLGGREKAKEIIEKCSQK